MQIKVEILCVLLGAVITISTDFLYHYIDKKNRRKHNARLLYYDILSINKYVDQYNRNRTGVYVDLRYNGEWQKILLELDFLSSEQVECIYNLYDAVYDFDYSPEYTWRQECFDKIEKVIKRQEFKNLMRLIKDKAKVKGDV